MASSEPLVQALVEFQSKGFKKLKFKIKEICSLIDVVNKKKIAPKFQVPKIPKGLGAGAGGFGGPKQLSDEFKTLQSEAKAAVGEAGRAVSRLRTQFKDAGIEVVQLNFQLEQLKGKLATALKSGSETGLTKAIDDMDRFREKTRDTINVMNELNAAEKSALQGRAAAAAKALQNAKKAKVAAKAVTDDIIKQARVSVAAQNKIAAAAAKAAEQRKRTREREALRTGSGAIQRRLLQSRIEADRLNLVLRNIAQAKLTKVADKLDRIKAAARKGGLAGAKLKAILDKLARTQQLVGGLVRVAAVLSVIGRVALKAARVVGQQLVAGLRSLGQAASLVVLPLTGTVRAITRLLSFAPDIAAFAAVRFFKEGAKEFETFTGNIARMRIEFNLFGKEGARETDRLKKLFIELGRTTLNTQSQFALGTRELGKSGLESFEVTRPLLKSLSDFALVSNQTLAKASSQAVVIASQFQESRQTVIDALVATASISPDTEVVNVTQGLANIAATATLAGVSLNEVLAAFSGFKSVNQGLTKSGTTLTTSFSRLFHEFSQGTARSQLLFDTINAHAKETGITVDDIFTKDRSQFVKDTGFFNIIEAGDIKPIGKIIRDIVGIKGFRFSGLFEQSDEIRKRFLNIEDAVRRGITALRSSELLKSLEAISKLLDSAVIAFKTFIFTQFEAQLIAGKKRVKDFVNALTVSLDKNNIIDRIVVAVNELLPDLKDMGEKLLKIAAILNTVGFAAFTGFIRGILPRMDILLDTVLQKLERFAGVDFTNLDTTLLSLEESFKKIAFRIEFLIGVVGKLNDSFELLLGPMREAARLRGVLTGLNFRGFKIGLGPGAILNNALALIEEIRKLQAKPVTVDAAKKTGDEAADKTEDAGKKAAKGVAAAANVLDSTFKSQILKPEAFQNLLLTLEPNELAVAQKAQTTAIQQNNVAVATLTEQQERTAESLVKLNEKLDDAVNGQPLPVSLA